jgi:hypothetical protein
MQHDGLRRETSNAGQPAATSMQRSSLRLASLALPFSLTLVVASVAYYFRFSIAQSIWTVASLPAVASTLFAIVLTVGVCGSIASAVIWWACRRELRASRIHQTEIPQNLAMHGTHRTNEERRQAA